MNDNLIKIFGEIVKTSRDTGLDIASNYRNNVEIPKAPDLEQKALIELIKNLDNTEFQLLEKGIKYCIELSLFKLISTIESGVGSYSFDLSIKDDNDKSHLVGGDIDNELSFEYWKWVS